MPNPDEGVPMTSKTQNKGRGEKSVGFVPTHGWPIRLPVCPPVLLPASVLTFIGDEAQSDFLLQSPQVTPAVVVLRRRAGVRRSEGTNWRKVISRPTPH